MTEKMEEDKVRLEDSIPKEKTKPLVITIENPWKIASIALAIVVVAILVFVLLTVPASNNGAIASSPSNSGALATGNSPSQGTGPTIKMSQLLDDDPFLGSPNAPVVLVEFSDFQCPFCRKFYNEALAQIETNYVNTGKVQFVYRDFPLNSIHPMAQPYAEAAECADDQGKWREMHDIIFEKQNAKGAGTIFDFTTDNVKQWAQEMGLNAQTFNSCLDSGKYAQEVMADEQAGASLGITGTPGFLIGRRDGTPQLISGAQPYSVFQAAIEQFLQNA